MTQRRGYGIDLNDLETNYLKFIRHFPSLEESFKEYCDDFCSKNFDSMDQAERETAAEEFADAYEGCSSLGGYTGPSCMVAEAINEVSGLEFSCQEVGGSGIVFLEERLPWEYNEKTRDSSRTVIQLTICENLSYLTDQDITFRFFEL